MTIVQLGIEFMTEYQVLETMCPFGVPFGVLPILSIVNA
jgi:hypothetical protein